MAKKATSVIVFQEALPFGNLSLAPRETMAGSKGKVMAKKPHRKRSLTPAQVWAPASRPALSIIIRKMAFPGSICPRFG